MSDWRAVADELAMLETEQLNPSTDSLELLTPLEIVRSINSEDRLVADAVARALEPISRAASRFAETYRKGGRIFYVGAGTSGRLGVLDASECPPTFGTDPSRIVGIISGGYETLVLSREGVEDDEQAAERDLSGRGVNANDLVIGIAASRRTPYTLAALRLAKQVGAGTIFIICASSVQDLPADIVISIPVGPEVIAGSTRMKAGSAQKMALNLISTSAMILLGKTYRGRMVDLQVRSQKLAARSRQMLSSLLDIDLESADAVLAGAGGSAKVAIVMQTKQCSREEAIRLIDEAGGFLRRIPGLSHT